MTRPTTTRCDRFEKFCHGNSLSELLPKTRSMDCKITYFSKIFFKVSELKFEDKYKTYIIKEIKFKLTYTRNQ